MSNMLSGKNYLPLEQTHFLRIGPFLKGYGALGRKQKLQMLTPAKCRKKSTKSIHSLN